MTLVFLDTETTGLDPATAQVWEIAYAVEDESVHAFQVRHTLEGSDLQALVLNGYAQRRNAAADPVGDWWESLLREVVLPGATLVCANPAFDSSFLRARWGVAPWHYRMLDVSVYAMPFLRAEKPVGLAGVAKALRELGHEIPEPDHSAAADVATLRACVRTLQREYQP